MTNTETKMIRAAAAALHDAGYSALYVYQASYPCDPFKWNGSQAAIKKINEFAAVLNQAGIHDTPVHEMCEALNNPHDHDLNHAALLVWGFFRDVGWEVKRIEVQKRLEENEAQLKKWKRMRPTPQESGRKGGKAVLAKYGREHFRKLAKIAVKKRPRSFYREIALRRWRKEKDA